MSRLSVLVIDDDDAELELMGAAVRVTFPDAQFHASSDPTAAVSICERERIDCVVVDYNMPAMDGLACAHLLRKLFPYLPIILSTGVGDEMLAARAVTSGVTDYIPKSKITPESFKRTVDRALQVNRQARVIDEQRSELESFAYALAHDFKQPIRQIRTFTRLVADAIHQGDTGELEQHLSFLDNAARRLADLVDVMSQYTLLNNPPEIEDVDLGAVLAEVCASLALYIEERGGQVIAGPAPLVRGNHVLMTQVLQNLAVNGLKYNINSNPKVSVAAEIVEGDCVIKVVDNGIGIYEEYLDEIFKPLCRLHNSSEYPGTGLGLTLARKAIHAQHGAIWCTSQPGIGSEFFVRIPLADQARPVDDCGQDRLGATA